MTCCRTGVGPTHRLEKDVDAHW